MSENENNESRYIGETEKNLSREKIAEAEFDAAAVEGQDADAQITLLQEELNQQKDAHLRALAETENMRRRMTREKEDAVRYASSGFARDLVTVADNLRRALQSMPQSEVSTNETVKTLVEGVAATERELLSTFEKHGVKRIDPLDQKFDHNFHQAMFEIENSGKPAGTVVQVLQAGYVQHDRLLRAAMVGVAKGPVTAAQAENDTHSRQSRIDTTA